MLGESGAGKTENCRMIVKFLSKISGKFIPLQRQRSSNSIASYKSSPNSSSSTPKHKSAVISSNSLFQNEKSSCFKSGNKKFSRVEFDFSYQSCNESDSIKFCPKHNCNQILSSSSSNASHSVEIPKQKSSSYLLNDFPSTSNSFTMYETLSHAQNAIKTINCQKQLQSRCEKLDLMSETSQTERTDIKTSEKMSILVNEKNYSSKTCNKKVTKSTQNNSELSYNKNNIDLNTFKKNAKRKVPTKSVSKLSNQLNLCLEIQTSNVFLSTMKERIAQAETFLEAMGGASTVQNRDSSRYVRIY